MKPARAAFMSVITAASLLLVGCGGVLPSGERTTTPPPTSASPSPPSTIASGVYGLVTAGPTCPVERVDQPCPPRPVSTLIEARGTNGEAVAATHSDADGRYALDLTPGSYVLVIGGSTTMWPRCPTTSIKVGSGSRTHTDISCDTGIR